MERSRSKRSYYYDQDYDSQTPSRTKPRYHHHSHHYNHRRGSGGRPSKPQDLPPQGPITYRILCPDVKVGGVIGKSGSIIKTFRQETGAWISVHPLIHGDEERIIEISDARGRETDGRSQHYSPAQEALLMIHERIIDCDGGFGVGFEGAGGGDDEDDYGPRGSSSTGRIATRLIVPRTIVGCLLGKGGKIIEQMRIETKTQIRILPRDRNMPQCVTVTEEIVQVVGDGNAVKKAVAIISSRLKEAMLRDCRPFRGRLHSPEHYFPLDDDLNPHINNVRSPLDGVHRSSSRYSQSGYGFDSAATQMGEHAQAFAGEDLVFQILCPNKKVESVIGESEGIIGILRGEIGVDVRVSDPVLGSDERVITISSDEGPDDEMFPAQEALLHIQTCIVDLGPDEDNIIATRLLVPADEVVCLEGRDGSLSDMGRLTGANIQILPREELPQCAAGTDELVQIIGDIRAAREALLQITLRLRSYLYRELVSPVGSGPGHGGSGFGVEAPASPSKSLAREGYQANEPPAVSYQNIIPATTTRPSKDIARTGSGQVEQEENNAEEAPSVPTRFHAPIVTKSTLEVIIPEHAIPSLRMRSGSKLAQISEMSGATVKFVEDNSDRPEKVIQISGTPEQAERAQSLLQGFILSTQEDTPT
ncbi:RNA-binding KH domain-containing protein RCF3-like [Aristolochia californica]|uniref:RNA-binding KH domain-containing protein RCF3-like n=1 Tax=Aristolochia californica TaxID=171875 RepID=UPI0035D77AD4